MYLAKTTAIALRNTVLVLAAATFAACSMADFRAADTRRNLLLEDVHRRVGQLKRIVDDGPDPIVAAAVKAETKKLKALVDEVNDVDAGKESARDELVGKETELKQGASATQTVIELNERLAALRKKVKEKLAAAKKTPPKDKEGKAAVKELRKLDDELTKFDPAQADNLASALDAFERRYTTELAKLEKDNPDLLAQEKLRGEIQALIARGKTLKDWGDADRRNAIEKARNELNDLLGKVPDPATSPLEPSKREEAATEAKRLAKEVARLERDYQVLVAPWFRAHGGSITVSPYTLQANPSLPGFELTQQTQTSYYVELDFHHRKAWLQPKDRFEVDPNSSRLFQALAPDDHEIRLRFMGDTSVGDTTAASASAGDFMIEGSSGWNLVEFQRRSNREYGDNPEDKLAPAGSLNFELNGGITTNRSVTNSHSYLQAGLVSAWSFPVQLADRTYRAATVLGGVYYGLHEFPQIGPNDNVVTTNPRPHYNHLGALGVRVDFTVPLTERLEFIAGVRYFSPISRDHLPDDWSLFLGASLPLGRIVRSIIGDPQ
ncbi:MAG: hypothetical protein NXI31_13200 [bacterium]|nr:hypothetical protein [bacterium]